MSGRCSRLRRRHQLTGNAHLLLQGIVQPPLSVGLSSRMRPGRGLGGGAQRRWLPGAAEPVRGLDGGCRREEYGSH